MEMLVKAIRRIVKVHGKEGFHSSKTFCAMIDVLVPKLERERKIFRRVLDDDILKELGELWESNAEQNNDSWKRIEETLTDEYGIREDWCRIVLDSFSKAYYNENENMSKRETSTQSQILEQEKEVINVSLQKQEQKIDENINEPKVENQISAEVLEGERTEPNIVQDIDKLTTESEIEKEISEEVLEERTEPKTEVIQKIDKIITESEVEKELSEEVLEEEKAELNVVQDIEEKITESEIEKEISEEVLEERTEPTSNVVQDIEEKITESEVEKEISEEVLEERTEPTSNLIQDIAEKTTESEIEKEISEEVLEEEKTEPTSNLIQDISEKITESEIEKEISEEVLEEKTEPTSNLIQDISEKITESEVEKEISEEVLEEEITEAKPEVVQSIDKITTESEVEKEISKEALEEKTEAKPEVVQSIDKITTESEVENQIPKEQESYQNNKKLEQQVTKTAKVNTVAIMGIGGAGLNVINSIVPWQMEDFQLIGVDTDKVALQYCKADKKLLLGERISKGLREGIKPEVGEKAAKESTQMIAEALKGIRILFLVGSLGGGTATGASPIIADIARKMKIFTIAVVTKPFRFEAKRLKNVEYGLERMKKNADALILLSNDVIFEVIDKKTTMLEALTVINDANLHMIQSIRNIINPNAEKHLTLTEFKTFVGMEKVVHIGTGTGKGKDKLQKALAQALNSPWLEHTISSNSQVVLQISGDINQQELDLGVLYLYQWTQVGRVISGMYYDKNKTDEISVLLVVVDK